MAHFKRRLHSRGYMRGDEWPGTHLTPVVRVAVVVVMRKTFQIVVGIFWYFGLLTESSGHRAYNGAYKYSVPSVLADSVVDQILFPVPYGGPPRFLYRNSDERRDMEETRPLCEEERKSQNIRELIQSSSSNFLQSGNNFEIKKYNLIPRKVDVIKCVGTTSNEEKSGAVCKPENCRERKVDVEVFGRLKNETTNSWEFMGTLSAVPVACECFIRWKPEKCSKPVDIFTDF